MSNKIFAREFVGFEATPRMANIITHDDWNEIQTAMDEAVSTIPERYVRKRPKAQYATLVEELDKRSTKCDAMYITESLPHITLTEYDADGIVDRNGHEWHDIIGTYREYNSSTLVNGNLIDDNGAHGIDDKNVFFIMSDELVDDLNITPDYDEESQANTWYDTETVDDATISHANDEYAELEILDDFYESLAEYSYEETLYNEGLLQ